MTGSALYLREDVLAVLDSAAVLPYTVSHRHRQCGLEHGSRGNVAD
jgi:hypothetical protein